MKNPFSLPPAGTALQALEGLLLGLGAAYPLLCALDLPISFALCAACCVSACAVFLLLSCVKPLRGLFFPLLMAGMLVPLLPYISRPHALANALTLFLGGLPLALTSYARPVAIILSLLMTGSGITLAKGEHSFFPTFLITICVLFAVSFSGAQIAAAAFFPLAAAVLLSARAQEVSLARLLPHIALISLLTALAIPYAGTTSPALSGAAARFKQAIEDYFFFNDARTAFSLSVTGWQPLGSDRLGGAVSPPDTPVMQVEASGRTLLRAIVKNEYTGLSWQDSTGARRYLFVNPRFYALKNNLFDLSRPDKAVRESLLDFETISVTMRADAASTLYLTQRFTSPSGDGIVAYFSPAGELFATHSLTTGERYTFSGSRLTSETEGVRAAVLKSLNPADPYLEDVRSLYLQLPASVSPQVHALAQDICARLDNDYDRAAALCMHLQRAYPYTLLQNEPPANRDFVSWFLFEEQQGYCTSFASAMTVMCRTLGIPARYIEGYTAAPDPDGVARVTQQHAHAWVEVYFPGFGWLSFDPTPGSGQAPDLTGEDDDAPQPNPDAPESEDGDSPEEETPTPTPSPTPTPVPTPTPSPTPEHQNPAVTPTPEITPAPTPTASPLPDKSPTPPPQEKNDPDEPDPLAALFALLLLLALLLIAVHRLHTAAPANAAARARLAGDALLIWYAAIEEALRALGVSAAPGEAPATFLWRAQKQLDGKVELMRLGKSVCAARYSRHKLSKKHAAHAQSVYDALLARMTIKQRIGMYARRLALGQRIYR